MKTAVAKTVKKGTAETSEKSVAEQMHAKLLAAKERLDKAKELFRLRANGIRKAKRIVEKAPVRVEKLKEQIIRAKTGTTKSLETMLKQAKEMEEKAKTLKGEAVELDTKAKKITEDENDLRMELAEIRKSNRKSPSTIGGGVEKSFKLLFVKTLQRRKFVIKYDTDGAPIGAEKNGIKLKFNDFDAEVVHGKEKTTQAYSQGQALRYVDEILRSESAKSEEKDKKASQ